MGYVKPLRYDQVALDIWQSFYPRVPKVDKSIKASQL